jgi:NADH:ubiquinone oxidoreductase subunit 3 (subunit A)
MVFEDNYISYDVSYFLIVISFILFNVSIFLIFTLQDDSYLESYISTIGVDFVSWFLNEIKQSQIPFVACQWPCFSYMTIF